MVTPEPAFPHRGTAAPIAPAPRDTLARLGQMTRTITIEQCAYLALFVSAVLTRFWELGTRALHHDESLHAWFSYQYAIGKGYQHDPLMHGPFLFHLNALIYALFGATDASVALRPCALRRHPRHAADPAASADRSVGRVDLFVSPPDLAEHPLLLASDPARHLPDGLHLPRARRHRAVRADATKSAGYSLA